MMIQRSLSPVKKSMSARKLKNFRSTQDGAARMILRYLYLAHHFRLPIHQLEARSDINIFFGGKFYSIAYLGLINALLYFSFLVCFHRFRADFPNGTLPANNTSSRVVLLKVRIS